VGCLDRPLHCCLEEVVRPLRPRGSHPSPGEGSDLVMSLKSRGMGEGPTGPH
jgi:hypothetical protein